MRRLTASEREAFLNEPHIATICVAAGNSRPPLATPSWYHYRSGGDLTFFTGTQGRRARKTSLIERAGMVTVSVQTAELPYKYVTVEGTVVKADRPPSDEQMLAVVRRYMPEDMASQFVASELSDPSPTLVLYTVRPDRWLTGDFSDS